MREARAEKERSRTEMRGIWRAGGEAARESTGAIELLGGGGERGSASDQSRPR